MTGFPRSIKLGIGAVLVVLVLVPVVVCQVSLRRTARHYDREENGAGVSLREFPFPFRCALTISSDVDGTTSVGEFLTIQEFLNTRNQTPLGQGLGLEIGNTFFAKSDRFGFLSPNPVDREVILDLLRSGYVDGIHSFDMARTREEIERVVETLSTAGASIDVWINHGTAPSNLGPGSGCLGDDDGSVPYHTDFSVNRLGYEFVWMGAVSGIVGQGRPISSASFVDGFDRRHPIRSLLNNVAQEQMKFTLAALGSSRYSMRRYNELVRVARLDDGQPVFEFTRSNQCPSGLWGECATAPGLADTLRDEVLDALVDGGGYMIVYTHLGKNEGFPHLPPPTVQALRSLAERNRSGTVWVTTTSRLLRYYVNKTYLQWEASGSGGETEIVIQTTQDPVRGVLEPDVEALGGVTFYVEDPEKTTVLLSGEKIEVVMNPPDGSGRKSVTIPLRPLERLDDKMNAYRSRGYF